MSFTSIASEPYAWPYDGGFSGPDTALVIIDMQIDFCGSAAMWTRWATICR